MKKTDDTTPVVKAPKVTPNPGQIFEEPVEGQSETGTASSESADAPAQPES
jgi:hypothetical protein